MGYYADIYVAKETRSKKEALAFLNHFVPERVESADEYEFPQYTSITSRKFENVVELMDHLEKNSNEEYNLYWRSIDQNNLNRHAMLFYTKDGAIIFGISRDADSTGQLNTENEDSCLDELMQYFSTDIGYITYEQTPADSFAEFKKVVKLLK
jgi:hypothetical protein